MIINHFYKFSLFLVSILFLFSCRKDPKPCVYPIIEEMNCNYESYSTSDFFHLYDSFPPQQFPTEPLVDYGEYIFHNPVFNPNNSCEIIYAKKDNSLPNGGQEVWKFNFENGESSLIVDNYIYSLDWGVNGWIIYTAVDYQVYKVKENGDSLTQLTNQGGGNDCGKWNPSGTLFWSLNNGIDYIATNGLVADHHDSHPISIIDWINDSTLIGIRNNNLYSMTLPNEDLSLLNSQNIDIYPKDKIFDEQKNLVYSTYWSINEFGEEIVNYYSYSLDGSNSLDIIKPLYGTYFYNYPYGGDYDGDVQDGKIVLTLQRGDWPDLLVNEIYRWYDIVIMNTDGSDERMLTLP